MKAGEYFRIPWRIASILSIEGEKADQLEHWRIVAWRGQDLTGIGEGGITVLRKNRWEQSFEPESGRQ
jgi:hypothetical protein